MKDIASSTAKSTLLSGCKVDKTIKIFKLRSLKMKMLRKILVEKVKISQRFYLNFMRIKKYSLKIVNKNIIQIDMIDQAATRETHL